ncbi:hypothetical protein ACFO4E_00420 [Nocardiopsis mangrovi]|uniref:Uncharacterized protein n=1 Tax=Nocardiopsis mangrovi TaxID=1179818 RepID=A0ABV9DN10_9ACTN
MLETPDGGTARIDRDIVPLVRRLWGIGIRLRASCQNFGESLHEVPSLAVPPGDHRWSGFYQDRVWLKLSSEHACRLVALLASNDELRSYMREWGGADSWICSRFIVPNAFGGDAVTSDDAHIFFPSTHLPVVICTLDEVG